jgi:hypothetical protein
MHLILLCPGHKPLHSARLHGPIHGYLFIFLGQPAARDDSARLPWGCVPTHVYLPPFTLCLLSCLQGTPSLEELKLKYYSLIIRYHAHENEYLEICR